MFDNSKSIYEQYQQKALSFAVFSPDNAISYTSLGLIGEWGEIAGKVSKIVRGDTTLEAIRDDLIKEAGDFIWMIAAAAYYRGLYLQAVDPVSVRDGEMMNYYTSASLEKLMVIGTYPIGLYAAKVDSVESFEFGNDFKMMMAVFRALCGKLNTTPAEVMEININKLEDRRQRNAIQGEGDNR